MGSLPVTALALFPQLGRQRYSIAADATGYIHIYDSQASSYLAYRSLFSTLLWRAALLSPSCWACWACLETKTELTRR